jgi:hypothetical protein
MLKAAHRREAGMYVYAPYIRIKAEARRRPAFRGNDRGGGTLESALRADDQVWLILTFITPLHDATPSESGTSGLVAAGAPR